MTPEDDGTEDPRARLAPPAPDMEGVGPAGVCAAALAGGAPLGGRPWARLEGPLGSRVIISSCSANSSDSFKIKPPRARLERRSPSGASIVATATRPEGQATGRRAGGFGGCARV